MADTRYLKQRRLSWYYRVPVPRALQPELGGKSHIEGTLKTRDLSLAQRLRWQHVQAAHAIFEGLRGDGGELTPAEIEVRAWAVYDATLANAEKHEFDEENIDLNLHHIFEEIEDGGLTEVEQAEAWARNRHLCADSRSR